MNKRGRRIFDAAFLFLFAAMAISGQGQIGTGNPDNKEDTVPVKSVEKDVDRETNRKFEVGLHFTNIRFETFDPFYTREFRENDGLPYVAPKKSNDSGAGLRFTYNLNKNIAVEAEANWLFQKDEILERPLVDTSPYPGGQKWQMFFGPKIGKRWKNLVCSERYARDLSSLYHIRQLLTFRTFLLRSLDLLGLLFGAQRFLARISVEFSNTTHQNVRSSDSTWGIRLSGITQNLGI